MAVAPIAAWSFEDFLVDRRARQRFPLALALEYRLLGRGQRRGSGRTRNISSSGLLFEVADPRPFSGAIELMVTWPCLLDDECALKLVVRGRVVRNESGGVAIESTQHEFRTAGSAKSGKRANPQLNLAKP
jgi:hypothetical protein